MGIDIFLLKISEGRALDQWGNDPMLDGLGRLANLAVSRKQGKPC
jgi:hypothetical protein